MISLTEIKRILIEMKNDSLIEPDHYDAIEKGASYATYGASSMTVAAGITINELGVVVGIIATLVTMGFNIWFKMKYQRGERRDER